MIRSDTALVELFESDEWCKYVTAGDPKNPLACWTICGDYRHDFIWIILSNNKTEKQIVKCIPSLKKDLPMRHRGELCEEDAQLIEIIAGEMWERYHKELKL